MGLREKPTARSSSRTSNNRNTAIAIDPDPRVLRAPQTHRAGAVIWQRSLPAVLQSWLANQAADKLPAIGLVARPRIVAEELTRAAAAQGQPPSPGRDALIADVAELCHAFAANARLGAVHMRLSLLNPAELRARLTDRRGPMLLTVYHDCPSGPCPPDGHCHGRDCNGDPARACAWRLTDGREIESASVICMKGRFRGPSAAPLDWQPANDINADCPTLYVLEIGT